MNREVIFNSHPAESLLPSQGRATDLYSTKAWGFDWDLEKAPRSDPDFRTTTIKTHSEENTTEIVWGFT